MTVTEQINDRTRSGAGLNRVNTPSLEPATGTDLAPPSERFPAPLLSRRVAGWTKIALILLILGLGGGGAAFWWLHLQGPLPAGFVSGNGRIEADEIDIATKFAGRLAELRVSEGDLIKAGEVVARMDTRDLEASLKRAEAQILQAQKVVEETRATVE